MFFSGRTWIIVIILSTILGTGIRRDLQLRSAYEQFKTNSTLPAGIDAESISKEGESR